MTGSSRMRTSRALCPRRALISAVSLALIRFTAALPGLIIRQFTAVINPPQAAILAVGEAIRQPVVRVDQVIIATAMTLTLSIDHRAAAAARFLTRLRELIEQPLDVVL
jgi:pyruvate dehydrogenase E2 component (dihydrolipoamide acetyltransferase)